MPYNAGGPTAGSSFGAIGPRINANVASFQDAQDAEKLRQFYSALRAQQQATPLQGYDAQGIALPPPPTGPAITPPTLSTHYVNNAGLNALLNSVIKPSAGGVGGVGGVGESPGADGALGALGALGGLGHGNVGKWAALLKAG